MYLRSAIGFVLYALCPVMKACDRHYMQRCDTCTIGSRCKSKLNAEAMLYVADHCKELCERNTSCLAAEYHPVNSSCKMYDCTSMGISNGYTSVVFRKSCSKDCSEFRLTLEDLKNSSISVCTLANLGDLSNQDCMAKCFDTEDCRALVYPEDPYDCMLCSSTEEMSLDVVDTKLEEARLMRRICITDEPRNYTQTCLNCDKGNLCQDSFEQLTVHNASSCRGECNIYANCKQSIFDLRANTCKLYNCGLVQETTDMRVYRKSSSNDCLVFEISILKGFYGSCTILEIILHVPLGEYCVDKCLDTPGCRAATYIEGKNCRLHACDNYTPTAVDTTFLQRKCIVLQRTVSKITPHLKTISSSLDEKASLSSNVFPVSFPVDDDLQAHEAEHTTDRKSVPVTAIRTTSVHQTYRLMNSLVQVSSVPTSDSGDTSTETMFVSTDKLGLVDSIKKTMSNLPSLSTVSNSTLITKFPVPSGTANTLERFTGIMSVLPTTTIAVQVHLHFRSERTSVTTMAASELENLANNSSSSYPGALSQQPSTTTSCPEALRLSNKSAIVSLEQNSTGWKQYLLANQKPLSEQKTFSGQQLYILVASLASGIFATTCAGPLLYFLVCRKKKVKPCSAEVS